MAYSDDPIGAVQYLYKQLVERRSAVDRCAAYYDGAHNLAFASEKFLDAFGGLFRAFADNWCGVVVDAVEERLNVEGFRADAEAAETDDAAWDIWQRNTLDAQSQLAHQEALISGQSYAVVWPGEDGRAEVMVESAVNTIVEHHPKIRTRRTAALRCWFDDERYEHVELFLPDDVYLFRSKSRRASYAVSGRGGWIVDPDAEADVDANGRMPNELGVVPVVTFHNRPRLYVSSRARWGVHSELAAIMPLQDAVNKLVADMLVASEFAGFPQRWATGYEPQVDRDTGQELPPPFKPGAGGVWVTEMAESSFGQFAAADLGNFVTAVDMVIQHIASISRTPPHYLNASADRLSGESIKAAETGLVAKTKRRMRYFGEAWEEVMRLAGQIEGNDLADATSMEVVWADPESRTEAEQTDAAMKKQTLNVPDEQLWEDLGYTPTQRSRFRAMRAQQAFLRPAPPPPLQPTPPPVVEEVPPAA